MLNRQFKLNVISMALFSTLVVPALYAEESKQLNDVVVTGTKKKVHRKENEVTGLGKLVKNIDSINKEQILNIRDLTRYDPGISVVEQGRGASAGYSIRGVDRNRVALVVDGLPQVQSYQVTGTMVGDTSGGSGAINEVEYENIRAIEISKGASSAEYGSGSLGGAVGFTTKEAKDVIKPGQSWGFDVKNAYSGKNKQWTNSLAFAGEHNGFDALVIYTHRDGKELQVHDDAGKKSYEVQRVGTYLNEYALLGTPNEKDERGWFVVEGEDQSSPKINIKNTRETPFIRRENPPFTLEEEKAYESMVHPKEIMSGDQYTGAGRIKPNPMDYKTDSWLARLGYTFSDKHYVGGIFEHTKQQYDIRDMSVPLYFTPEEEKKNTGSGYVSGVYEGNNPLDGAFIYGDSHRAPKGLRWSRTQFIDEHHSKVRKGLLYRYTNKDKDSWVDNASLTFDRQEIELDNFMHIHNCSEYPTVDKNCRASIDKPWSYYESERNVYTEKHNVLKLNLDKTLKLGMSKHNLGLLTGIDKFESALGRRDYYHQSAVNHWNSLGRQADGYWHYQPKTSELITKQYCNWNNPTGLTDCNTRTITGHNSFLALRDHIAFGKYVDLGLGARYDYHTMHSDDSWTGTGKYRTFSWNTGLVVKPTKNISLSYRVSTGFRVPSFQEQFGIRIPGYEKGKDDDAQYVSKLTPEKAFNQEIGITFRGDFGTFETSFFKNDYKDMIAIAKRKGLDADNRFSYGYHNAQEIQLTGVNLLAKIDWNGVWDKIPEGIYTSLAYNKIKPKKVKNDENYTHIRSPLLDSLQPSRYVVGMGYDHPDEKWGITGLMTHSKGKSNAELVGSESHGGQVYDLTSTKKRTKPWTTYDVIGYVKVKDFLTLRAGVYNLFNTRYVTWESVRQSSVNSLNSHRNVNSYERYAAPGRNFTVSAEMKF